MSFRITPMKYRLFLLFIKTQCFSDCTLWRIIYYNASGIDDYKKFSARKSTASSNPFQFIENSDDARILARAQCAGQDVVLDALLAANQTVAFLILKNDTRLFEKYYQHHSDTALSLSFSMAKSFLSIWIGCAIDDSLIRAVDQSVTDFVPELKSNGFDRVTIEHLLQITSGMDYAEIGFPLGLHSHFYYYNQDLEQKILNL